jgi:hypothetical protein
MACWIVAFLFSLQSFVINDRLQAKHEGDFLVLEEKKMITLISIRSVSEKSIIVEEISAPKEMIRPNDLSWSEWVQRKAPGHTSWALLDIPRNTADPIQCYSFSKGVWVHLDAKEHLLAHLLHLKLEEVPVHERRRIGPPPMHGEADRRKIWQPQVGLDKKIAFIPHQTMWPQDDSPLSGQKIILYFDASQEFIFPVWIQVETTHLNVALKTVGVGHHLPQGKNIALFKQQCLLD